MGCGCNKRKRVQVFTVKRPGQPDKTVTSETAAQQLTRGIQGATYRPTRSA